MGYLIVRQIKRAAKKAESTAYYAAIEFDRDLTVAKHDGNLEAVKVAKAGREAMQEAFNNPGPYGALNYTQMCVLLAIAEYISEDVVNGTVCRPGGSRRGFVLIHTLRRDLGGMSKSAMDKALKVLKDGGYIISRQATALDERDCNTYTVPDLYQAAIKAGTLVGDPQGKNTKIRPTRLLIPAPESYERVMAARAQEVLDAADQDDEYDDDDDMGVPVHDDIIIDADDQGVSAQDRADARWEQDADDQPAPAGQAAAAARAKLAALQHKGGQGPQSEWDLLNGGAVA